MKIDAIFNGSSAARVLLDGDSPTPYKYSFSRLAFRANTQVVIPSYALAATRIIHCPLIIHLIQFKVILISCVGGKFEETT